MSATSAIATTTSAAAAVAPPPEIRDTKSGMRGIESQAMQISHTVSPHIAGIHNHIAKRGGIHIYCGSGQIGEVSLEVIDHILHFKKISVIQVNLPDPYPHKLTKEELLLFVDMLSASGFGNQIALMLLNVNCFHLFEELMRHWEEIINPLSWETPKADLYTMWMSMVQLVDKIQNSYSILIDVATACFKNLSQTLLIQQRACLEQLAHKEEARDKKRAIIISFTDLTSRLRLFEKLVVFDQQLLKFSLEALTRDFPTLVPAYAGDRAKAVVYFPTLLRFINHLHFKPSLEKTGVMKELFTTRCYETLTLFSQALDKPDEAETIYRFRIHLMQFLTSACTHRRGVHRGSDPDDVVTMAITHILYQIAEQTHYLKREYVENGIGLFAHWNFAMIGLRTLLDEGYYQRPFTLAPPCALNATLVAKIARKRGQIQECCQTQLNTIIPRKLRRLIFDKNATELALRVGLDLVDLMHRFQKVLPNFENPAVLKALELAPSQYLAWVESLMKDLSITAISPETLRAQKKEWVAYLSAFYADGMSEIGMVALLSASIHVLFHESSTATSLAEHMPLDIDVFAVDEEALEAAFDRGLSTSAAAAAPAAPATPAAPKKSTIPTAAAAAAAQTPVEQAPERFPKVTKVRKLHFFLKTMTSLWLAKNDRSSHAPVVGADGKRAGMVPVGSRRNRNVSRAALAALRRAHTHEPH